MWPEAVAKAADEFFERNKERKAGGEYDAPEMPAYLCRPDMVCRPDNGEMFFNCGGYQVGNPGYGLHAVLAILLLWRKTNLRSMP
jgi:hypothetical protein